MRSLEGGARGCMEMCGAPGAFRFPSTRSGLSSGSVSTGRWLWCGVGRVLGGGEALDDGSKNARTTKQQQPGSWECIPHPSFFPSVDLRVKDRDSDNFDVGLDEGEGGRRFTTRAQLSEGGRGKNPDGVRVLGWWVGLIFFISHVEAGKIVAPLGAPTRPRGGHRPRGEMDKINSCTDASARNPHRLPRFWRAWSPKRRAEANARRAGPMGPGPAALLYASGAGQLASLLAGVGFRMLAAGLWCCRRLFRALTRWRTWSIPCKGVGVGAFRLVERWCEGPNACLIMYIISTVAGRGGVLVAHGGQGATHPPDCGQPVHKLWITCWRTGTPGRVRGRSSGGRLRTASCSVPPPGPFEIQNVVGGSNTGAREGRFSWLTGEVDGGTGHGWTLGKDGFMSWVS